MDNEGTVVEKADELIFEKSGVDDALNDDDGADRNWLVKECGF